jgi:anthranilate/para-aminobenzoate synthase component I
VAHSAYLKTGELEVLSNTMETLLTYEPDERLAQSFPIKGTRARSSQEPANLENAHLLKNHPKERAEHVMIVDLVRNDLGRVCVPGSVRVPNLMDVQGFRGVWHGVSTVEGRLCENQSLADLVAAVFPGGSITGAPKRRSMEIIQNIEEQARGFYTGSIGLLTPSGRLSMSILIRTLIHDEDGWSVSVGGGIVADSEADREIIETWEKVSVFNQILGNQDPDTNEQAG